MNILGVEVYFLFVDALEPEFNTLDDGSINVVLHHFEGETIINFKEKKVKFTFLPKRLKVRAAKGENSLTILSEGKETKKAIVTQNSRLSFFRIQGKSELQID